jgi:hypothetical protein
VSDSDGKIKFRVNKSRVMIERMIIRVLGSWLELGLGLRVRKKVWMSKGKG